MMASTTNSVINSLSGALAKARQELAESKSKFAAAEADAACVPELRDAITHLSSMVKTLLQRGSRQTQEINSLREERRSLLMMVRSKSTDSNISLHRFNKSVDDPGLVQSEKIVESHIVSLEAVCQTLLGRSDAANKSSKVNTAGQGGKEGKPAMAEKATTANLVNTVHNVHDDYELSLRCQKLEQDLMTKTEACNVLIEEVQQQQALIMTQEKQIEEQNCQATDIVNQVEKYRNEHVDLLNRNATLTQEVRQLRKDASSTTAHTNALRETAAALRIRNTKVRARLGRLFTSTIPLLFYNEREAIRDTKENIEQSLNAFSSLLDWGIQKLKGACLVESNSAERRILLRAKAVTNETNAPSNYSDSLPADVRHLNRYRSTIYRALRKTHWAGDLARCLNSRAMNRGDAITLHSLRGAIRRELTIPANALTDADIRKIFDMFAYDDGDRSYASIDELSAWVLGK